MGNISRGVCSDIMYDVAGGTTWKSLGIITSANIQEASGNPTKEIAGLFGRYKLIGGIAYPAGSFSCMPIKMLGTSAVDVVTDFLLEYGRRAETGFPCSALPKFDLKFFFEERSVVVGGCKVNKFTVKADQENPVTIDIDWIGETVTEGAAATAVELEGYEFPGIEGVVSVGNTSGYTEYMTKSFSMTVDNMLEPYSAMLTKSAGSKRRPLGVVEGPEKVSAEIETLELIPESIRGLSADVLPIDLKVKLVSINDEVDTLTVECIGMSNSAGSQDTAATGLNSMKYSFVCNSLAFANVNIAVDEDEQA